MKKLLVALLMVPTMAHAEFFTGNRLLEKLNSTEFGERMQALGYVQGVFDAGQYIKHCAPDNAGVTAGQAQDIVRNYLNQNPATRNFSADLLITDALKKIWPCASQNKGRGA
jgi:hypothetical protein